MSIRICIVDDEQDAQNVLLSLIEKSTREFDVIGVVDNYVSAKSLITSAQPDLVLLDINLGGKSGLDLAKDLYLESTAIVFVSAYDNHVLEALRLKAFDYLYKPVFLDDFEEMIDRYVLNQTELKKSVQEEATVVVNNNEGQHVIELNSVEFIEAAGAYCTLNLISSEKIMVSKPLKSFVTKFNESTGFLRTHKSFLVNLNCVSKLHYGENQIILKSGKIVHISRNQKSYVKKVLDGSRNG